MVFNYTFNFFPFTGGFVPKEPILDGPYFESKIETASTSVGPVMRPSPSEDLLVAGLDVSSSSTADPDFSAPLITFTEFSPEKLIEAGKLLSLNSHSVQYLIPI